ncbi:MAG: hypothetical protein ABR920_07970 [Terriglobales bacterium]
MAFESLKIHIGYRSAINGEISGGLTQQARLPRATPPENNVVSLVNGPPQRTLGRFYESFYPFLRGTGRFLNEYDEALYFRAI